MRARRVRRFGVTLAALVPRRRFDTEAYYDSVRIPQQPFRAAGVAAAPLSGWDLAGGARAHLVPGVGVVVGP